MRTRKLTTVRRLSAAALAVAIAASMPSAPVLASQEGTATQGHALAEEENDNLDVSTATPSEAQERHAKDEEDTTVVEITKTATFSESTKRNAEEIAEAPFDQSVRIDNTEIRVKADKGVFPEDASLFVQKVTDAAKTRKIRSVIENGQEKNQSQGECISFDITVRDVAGKELNPDTSRGRAEVIFYQIESEAWGGTPMGYEVFHFNDSLSKAEKLDATVDMDEGSIQVEAKHCSVYTVQANTLPKITIAAKPENGTTKKNPYPANTGGSKFFRIPSMVRLNNGTLVTAIDARWETKGDGGGLDTLVSWSEDNGENWTYTFANHLGDNGNKFSNQSSTFIDPSLATDGETLWLLVDLFPYGAATASTQNRSRPLIAETGFTDDGKLLLKRYGEATYDFYLDNGVIKHQNGTEVDGYEVDEWFNITGEGVNTNLFFSNSPFQVQPVTFLYLTESTDGGKNWSAPKLLNLKEKGELALIAAPTRGHITEDGAIVFTAYQANARKNDPTLLDSNSQRLNIIYSEDGGENWERVKWEPEGWEEQKKWSSESVLVELESGIWRIFYRNGTGKLCYVDYDPKAQTWKETVTDIAINSNNNLSAIKHSRTINGHEVIILSCATRYVPGKWPDRYDGKIFIFEVLEDGTLKKNNQYTMQKGPFLYSALAEMDNGDVAMLYENGDGTVAFTTRELLSNPVFKFDPLPIHEPEPADNPYDIPSDPVDISSDLVDISSDPVMEGEESQTNEEPHKAANHMPEAVPNASYEDEQDAIWSEAYVDHTPVDDGQWKQASDGSWNVTLPSGEKAEEQWLYLDWNGEKGWYYFDETGTMKQGCMEDSHGNTYYLSNGAHGLSGKMATGWQWIMDEDGHLRRYYFSEQPDKSKGKLLKNVTTPDGYMVNEKGQWIMGGIVQER